MITLITGVPGASKSLMAMELMREEYERNLAATKLPLDNPKREKPRTFWTDIDGATLAENPKAFEWINRMPDDYDWRKLPEGAFIVIDEAHQDHKFPEEGVATQRAKDKKVRDLDESRHAGKDLVFVTQHPTKVHREIRQLVGQHFHLTRGSGMAVAMLHTWSSVQTSVKDDATLNKGNPEIKRFDKSLYDRYFSSTLHTASHKFKVPMKWWGALCALVVGIFALWFFYDHFLMAMTKPKPKAATATSEARQGAAPLPGSLNPSGLPEGFTVVPNPDAPKEPTAQVPAPMPAVASQDLTLPAACVEVVDCKCWNRAGYRMKITRQECRVFLKDFGYIRMDNGQTASVENAVLGQSLVAAGSGNPATAVIQGQGVSADIPPPAAAPVSSGTSTLSPLR